MQSKKALSLLLAALFIIGTVLTGCTGSNEASSGKSSDGASGKNGGKLVIAELSDATQLDPHKGTDIPSANVYHGKIYEGLVKQDKDMEIQPALATEWKKIDDLTWEFKLREGVKFHDGTEFKADAVKKTIERILDPEIASPRAKLFEMIKEVKVVDDYTVQLITEYPFAPLLANLAHYSGGIISPAAIEKYGDTLGQHPVGTGPFKFDSWTPGQEINLVKNDDYWGKKAKVDQVVFKVIPEDATRIAMVETGEAHIAEPVPVTDVQRIEGSSSMKLNRSEGLGIDYVGFNVQKKPFDDVRVRQAINLATDTDVILEGVYNNVGTKATAPMGPGVWGHNPNLEGYGYDVNKAKELLAEAGYKDGFKTTIWTNDNKARVDLAEVLQSQLKGVGIEAEVKVLEWGAYLEATANGEHDMFILGWSNMTGDADYNQYFLFHSEAIGNPGNRTFYSNPEVDKLIDAGRRESDPEKRKEIYAKAQKIEMEDAPMIFIRNDEDLVALGNNVKGFWMHPAGTLMINDVSIK
ncbi:glutathione ABC transporter substrate-binding protein [Pseudalkalibacillus caeni]|uniref:Glutathione ABC transporter substrate-binding protein n=1 Tax=Exobacillus caeni TaxID=2574798 RepID=A0A5R9F6I6_9BACL|nr:glutathione ABC transporter substrate-binding protein [Pseudalkalibacillus caeni]TLS38641.1 glutathione ABC transporter substrate-binding protein [Pseudalkalibacillus caeni]